MPKRISTISELPQALDGSGFPAIQAVRACLEAPVFEYNGARKIVQSVGFEMDRIPTVDLASIGYNQKVKMKALDRMYYDPTEAKRVIDLLSRRRDQAYTAVAFSFRAGAKDGRSMGHCLETMVIATTPKRTVVEILYRSTEVIKKHTADLAFIPVVLERLGLRPDRLKFYFTNAYLSGVFFPSLFLYWDPIQFLDLLRTREHKLFVVATRFLRRSVKNRGTHFPYSPERLQHELAWKHYPEKMPIIMDYLESYL